MEKFLLELPNLKDGISFSKEWVGLILVLAAMAGGIALCFWGYCYFQTIVLLLLGCISAAAGYCISTKLTDRLILQLCLVIMLVFLMVCMFYLLSIAGTWLLRRFGWQIAWQKMLQAVSPFLGALVIGLLIYTKIYRGAAAAVLAAVLFGASGFFRSRKKAKERRIFYSYEDLLLLKRPGEEEPDDRHQQAGA